jgi:hypothetical protein
MKVGLNKICLTKFVYLYKMSKSSSPKRDIACASTKIQSRISRRFASTSPLNSQASAPLTFYETFIMTPEESLKRRLESGRSPHTGMSAVLPDFGKFHLRWP